MKKFLEEAKQEKGNIVVCAIAEFIIYLAATFGFSDYVLGTLFFKKSGYVDDVRIPGTAVSSYIIPGLFIASTYLKGNVGCDPLTMILCVVIYTIGTIVGSRLVVTFDATRIKKIIGYAMLFSMLALVARLIISAGVSGTANGLHGWQFVVMLPIIFVLGIFNMMGVPMKPPLMSLFLLMGVSPLVTLTILMCMAVPAPIAGSISIFKSGRYQKKIFCCAATFGSLGAIIGGYFALNVNTLVLTIVLMIAMAYVAYSMLKK